KASRPQEKKRPAVGAGGRARVHPVADAAGSPDLYPLRHHKRLAVAAPEQLVRLGVALDGLRRRVEAEGPPDAEGDVAEVAQPRALVTLFDVRVGPLAAPHAVEEVLQVRRL